MKIVTHFLEDVAGIGVFPTVSFIIFFLFFIGVTWHVVRLPKVFVNEMAALPTDDSESNNEEMAE